MAKGLDNSRLLAAVVWVVGAAAGCSKPTQLVLSVDSDVAAAGATLTVNATRGDLRSQQSVALAGRSFPVSLGIQQADKNAEGPLAVTVGLEGPGGLVLEARRVVLDFPKSGKAYVHVCLPLACNGVRCGPGQSCGESGCISEQLPLSDSPQPPNPCGGPGPDGGQDDAGGDARDADDSDADASDTGPFDMDEGEAGTLDAAPRDGQPTDAPPTDGPPVDTGADSGVSDGPVDAGVPWPLPDWRHRIPIILSNPTARPLAADSVVRVVLDHVALTNPAAPFGPPYALPTGDDLVVVFEQTTIPRWAGGERGFGRSDTHLYFRLQRVLPAGATDGDYWLYFGNPTPTTPSTNGIPRGRILGKRLVTGTIIQPPNAMPLRVVDIELGPSRADEQWLVMARWRVQRTSGTERALGAASFTVDGAAVAELAGASAAQDPLAGKYASTWLLIPGRALSQQVVLSFARNGATGSAVVLDDARLTAVLLPERSVATSSDFVAAPAVLVPSDASVARVLPLDLAVPRYVWFGRSMFQQAPNDTGHLYSRVTTVPRMRGPSSVDYQVTDFSQSVAGAFSTLFSAREFASSDVLSVNLVHASTPASTGSRELGSGQFAIPTDGFEDVDSTFSRTTMAHAAGAMTHSSFQPAGHPQGKLRDYVYIYSGVGDFRGDADTLPVQFQYIKNGVVDGNDVLAGQGSSAPASLSWFWAETTVTPPRLEVLATAYAALPQVRDVWSRYHAHLVLRLNDPDSVFGPVENP